MGRLEQFYVLSQNCDASKMRYEGQVCSHIGKVDASMMRYQPVEGFWARHSGNVMRP